MYNVTFCWHKVKPAVYAGLSWNCDVWAESSFFCILTVRGSCDSGDPVFYPNTETQAALSSKLTASERLSKKQCVYCRLSKNHLKSSPNSSCRVHGSKLLNPSEMLIFVTWTHNINHLPSLPSLLSIVRVFVSWSTCKMFCFFLHAPRWKFNSQVQNARTATQYILKL